MRIKAKLLIFMVVLYLLMPNSVYAEEIVGNEDQQIKSEKETPFIAENTETEIEVTEESQNKEEEKAPVLDTEENIAESDDDPNSGSNTNVQFGNCKQDQVYSTSNMPEDAKTSSSSIDVITNEEIEEEHPVSMDELLNTIPGIYAFPSGSVGASTGIRMRGWNRSLIELDGIKINDPSFGSPALDVLLPFDLDRIEVLRGPQGTMHGTQAQGGLLSLYSKRGHGRPRIDFESGMGNNSTFRESFSFSGGNKDYDYYLGITRLDTTGGAPTLPTNASVNDDYRNMTVASNLAVRLLKGKAELRNTFRFINAKKEVGVSSGYGNILFDPNAKSINASVFNNFTFSHAPTCWYDYNVKFGVYKTRYKWFDPYGYEEPFFFDHNDYFKSDNMRLMLLTQHNLRYKDINTFTVGYELEYNDFETTSHNVNSMFSPISTDFNKDSAKNDVYFHDVINIKDTLFIRGGTRITHSNIYGTYATPNVSGALILPTVQIPNAYTKLRTSYGYSLNEPTLSQLFTPTWGNPQLTPEKLSGWDAGLTQSFFNEKLKMDVSYYNNKIKDLILFDFNTWQFNNVARARTRGWEGSIKIEPIKRLKAMVNYTYTFGREIDPTTNSWVELRSNPRHKWGYLVNYEFKPGYSAFWRGFGATSSTGFPPTRNNIDGYFDMGIGCTAKIIEKKGFKLSLWGVLGNILGKKYQPVEGARVPGIHFIAGLKLTKTF